MGIIGMSLMSKLASRVPLVGRPIANRINPAPIARVRMLSEVVADAKAYKTVNVNGVNFRVRK